LKAEIKNLHDKEAPTEADPAQLEILQQRSGTAGKIGLAEEDNDAKRYGQRMQTEPILAKALADAGLPPREFAKVMLSYFQAYGGRHHEAGSD
jgi:hypothetical protein